MKFSIITPTLNQSQYIEKTINSVLEQDYPDFEHIIIDGVSTDGTLEILKKYPHLKWISEKDSGQSNAINKGFRMATGDIVAWINSDDYYDSSVFKTVNDYFTRNSNSNFVYGDITYVDAQNKIVEKHKGANLTYENLVKCSDIIRQPSCFWKKCVIEKVGLLNENLHLVMDFDFFLRIGKQYTFDYIEKNVSFFRCYPDGKTGKFRKKQLIELAKVLYSHEHFRMYRSSKFILRKLIYLFVNR
jgi:glycosyltransferase involved in cell wall biosynthesis